MLWSRFTITLLAIGLAASPINAFEGIRACPAEKSTNLQFVDVFDGKPEDLASLIPDVAGQSQGHWNLGYVYDAGRTVTLRCKYFDGVVTDVTLDRRVNICSYSIGKKKVLSIHCR